LRASSWSRILTGIQYFCIDNLMKRILYFSVVLNLYQIRKLLPQVPICALHISVHRLFCEQVYWGRLRTTFYLIFFLSSVWVSWVFVNGIQRIMWILTLFNCIAHLFSQNIRYIFKWIDLSCTSRRASAPQYSLFDALLGSNRIELTNGVSCVYLYSSRRPQCVRVPV
jgi:hypothetical protein